MAKGNQPLLSLSAHGTIGKVLTYQQRGTSTIVRKKPVPVQPNTLAQQYQRWMYDEYVYRWHQLTSSQKQTYQSAGVRFHLTGFQYFMKYMLTNLPDFAGYWKLDINTTPTTPDSSRNLNRATITGASPATGPVGPCLYFDGTNDYLTVASDPSLTFINTMTLDFWANPDPGAALDIIAGRFAAGVGGFYFQLRNLKPFAVVYNYAFAPTSTSIIAPAALTSGQWYRLAMTYDGTRLRLYVDGLEVGNDGGGWAHPIGDTSGQPFQVAGPAYDWPGYLDDMMLNNRTLDPTELLKRSQRRWPL